MRKEYQKQEHTNSYYAASVNEITNYPALEGARSADVCVVGAGFAGVATALTLAERGFSVALVEANPWQWQTVTLNPVNERMIPGVSGRYCVFVRGALDATLAIQPNAVNENPMVRSQIAVVYPGGEQGFGNQVNNLGDCNALPGCTGATDGLLQPEGLDTSQSGTDALPPLEQCGWRAVYMGAVVTRRNG